MKRRQVTYRDEHRVVDRLEAIARDHGRCLNDEIGLAVRAWLPGHGKGVMDVQTARKMAATLETQGVDVTPQDILDVLERGSVEPGIVSEEHDEWLTERIQEALDEAGVS